MDAILATLSLIMDYEVGSIADLISGNHTPNRRKVAKKPLTPVKLPPVSNVTPATPKDSDKIKQRTPVLAFTPETNAKSSLKKLPSGDQFESPKSLPKKRKSKLSNNFQFLSQLPEYSDSGNEGFGEDDGAEVIEGILGKKKKKYSKEDAKKVVKEYYVGKEELRNEKAKGKQVNANQKKQEFKKSDSKESSMKKRKNKVSESEPAIDELSQEKRTKKKKNKKLSISKSEVNDNVSSSPKKKKKRRSESENIEAELHEDSGSENKEDDEIEMSDNEKNINEDLEENPPESDDDNKEDIPMTDFQKAASRRVEKKLQKQEKFSPEEIEKTLFVGNIPVSILLKNYEKVLKNKFSPYGGIESIRIRNIPMPDFKTKPKVALIEKKFHAERTSVIAYIKFRNPSSVQKALVENNSLLEGNHLRVDRCHGDKKAAVDSRKTIFLGNLPFNIEEETLREVFQHCGNITSVRLIRDRQTQIGKGIGFINFEKSDGVELAMSMSEEDLLVKKKTIRVQRYNPANKKEAPGKGKRRDNSNKRNSRENGVVGKRYQKFHQPEPPAENPKAIGKKRDHMGNKKRKRNLDSSAQEEWQKRREAKNAAKASITKPTESGHAEQNGETKQNGEHSVEDTKKSNSIEETRPSRKEIINDFKGLIAKKKKKNKLNTAILKKKKISKMLLHEAKN